MPTFPVPLFAAAVLLWLLALGLVRRDKPRVLLGLLALCALQAVLITLALHYGVAGARWLQPLTAAWIPPLVWLAFTTTAVRDVQPRDALHLLGPAFVAFCAIAARASLDLVIPALFAGYGAALLWGLRTGADQLPRLPLARGDHPARLWRVLALALIGSAATDAAIAAAQMSGRADYVPWIVSLASSLTLLLLGALALARDLQPEAHDSAPDPADTAAEADLLARLTAFMQADQPHLDPELSLNRLSRRLNVPAKRLSEAINRHSGGNVARYINGFRVQTACDLLVQGETVTQAMLAAGFNTKSNFNREFARVTGMAPSDWRAAKTLRLAQSAPTLRI